MGVEDVDRERCGEGEIGPRLFFAPDVRFLRMGLRLRDRDTLIRFLVNFSLRPGRSSLVLFLGGPDPFFVCSFLADDDEFRLDLFKLLRSFSHV